MRFTVPNGRTPTEYLSFGQQLAQLPHRDLYEADFGDVEFVTPGWMIVVGDALRKLRVGRPNAQRRAVNYKGKSCLSYASHAGFFRSFGMSYGNDGGDVRRTESFLPITTLQAEDVRSKAIDEMKHHGDVVQEEAERLVSILTQTGEGDVFDALSYSLREVVRNVLEHSESEDYTYAAQYWPTTGVAEIVVRDGGVGIKRSLQKNPKIDVKTDEDALALATSAGVTSVGSSRGRMDGPWRNSGYGLYMTRRLCGLGGSFVVASGSRAMICRGDVPEFLPTEVSGTTVILRLAANSIGDLADRLSEFRNAAAGAGRRPSGASLSSRVRARD